LIWEILVHLFINLFSTHHNDVFSLSVISEENYKRFSLLKVSNLLNASIAAFSGTDSLTVLLIKSGDIV